MRAKITLSQSLSQLENYEKNSDIQMFEIFLFPSESVIVLTCNGEMNRYTYWCNCLVLHYILLHYLVLHHLASVISYTRCLCMKCLCIHCVSSARCTCSFGIKRPPSWISATRFWLLSNALLHHTYTYWTSSGTCGCGVWPGSQVYRVEMC